LVKKRIRKSKEEKKMEIIQGRGHVETKNIPKNFTKAAITYILREPQMVKRVLPSQPLCEKFLIQLAQVKMTISNIKQFGQMLRDDVKDED
jgi:hypothetical protein